MIKPKVLSLYTGNSCRTQMAEAMLRQIAGDRFEIVSAGGDATPLDPEAVDAMKEIGIEISGQSSKAEFFGQRFSYVISLCDRQEERQCPIFRELFGAKCGRWKILVPPNPLTSAGRWCAGFEIKSSRRYSSSQTN